MQKTTRSDFCKQMNKNKSVNMPTKITYTNTLARSLFAAIILQPISTVKVLRIVHEQRSHLNRFQEGSWASVASMPALI